MWSYVLRRLLLMVPTLFGISMVVWLVMALSPGRPGTDRGQGALGGGDDRGKDALKLASENEAQRIFRRQFGLDRPVLLNLWWTTLDAERVREDVRTASAPIRASEAAAGAQASPFPPVDPEEKRLARERLEDYGYYAVPALVELLRTTEGVEQDYVRLWLTRNSIRLPVRTGAELDAETLARFQAWTSENVMLNEWGWEPGAPPEVREPIVERWLAWYEEHRDRWEYGAGEAVVRTLTDTQFGTYWGRLLRGDLGISHIYKLPVEGLVLDRLKYSLTLNLTALAIAYLLAVPLGIYSAVKQGTVADRAIGIALFALYSLPNFFVGTLFIEWFCAGQPWKIFPIGGFESETAAEMNTLAHFGDVVWHITLPLVCLTYAGLAVYSRYARTGMLEVIRSDYVRTARAKGLSEWVVILKHVVRNGILPIVTLLGTVLPVLIGGSIAIEYIFNINGMGLLMIQSIYQKDFNVVMGVQLIVGVLTMVGILLSDIAYALLDPRISLS